MGEPTIKDLLGDSTVAKKLGWRPAGPDAAEVHRTEARRRLSSALHDAIAGAPLEGGTVDVRRTPTADELQAEADERANTKANIEASKAREARLDADAKAAREQIAALERKVRTAEGEQARADRARAIEAEESRIRDRRAAKGKRALAPQELRRRAVERVQKGAGRP